MSLSKVKEEIMALMVLVDQKKMDVAQNKIDEVIESIHTGLDFAETDDDIVLWGKFLKIVESLQAKVNANG